MAAEALSLHVAGMREDGVALPASSGLDAVMAAPANRGAVAFLADVAARRARGLRINVMLPADLVAAIDSVSANRSQFLAEAARARLRALG